MYMLKDKEYIKEIPSGNNFGYVLMDNSYLSVQIIRYFTIRVMAYL